MPEEPLSALHPVPDPVTTETNLWTHLMGGLMRLSLIHRLKGDVPRSLRCEELLQLLETTLALHGATRDLPTRRVLRGARTVASALGPCRGPVLEARIWWTAMSAAASLSGNAALGGQTSPLARDLAEVHHRLGLLVACAYPGPAGEALVRAARAAVPERTRCFRAWLQDHLPSQPVTPATAEFRLGA